MLGVALVGERDDGVDAVVAAVELHDHQHPAVALRHGRAGRAGQEAGDGRTRTGEELDRGRPRKSRASTWNLRIGTIRRNQTSCASGHAQDQGHGVGGRPRAPTHCSGRWPARDPGAPVAGLVRRPAAAVARRRPSSLSPVQAVPPGPSGSTGHRAADPVTSDEAPPRSWPGRSAERVVSQRPAARPAADVGRVEQVLTQPAAPVGQHQRAAAAARTTPGRGPPR